MAEQDPTMRRLAVLVDTLDTKTASRFLDSTPDHDAIKIRQQVLELGRVSHQEREHVLRQFLFAVHGVQDEEQSIQVGQEVEHTENDQVTNNRVRTISPSHLPGVPVKSLLNLENGELS